MYWNPYQADHDVPVREVETQALQHRSYSYIRGPWPLFEFMAAARLPGKALALWTLVHHRIRLTGRSEITLPRSLLGEAGIDRNAKARALGELERAGLICVTREAGRTPRIALSGPHVAGQLGACRSDLTRRGSGR
jgi:hypothetical protein